MKIINNVLKYFLYIKIKNGIFVIYYDFKKMKNISDFIDNKVSYFYEIEFTRALSNEIMSLDEHIGNSVVDNIWDNNILSMNENLRFEITSRINLSLEKYFKKQKRLFLINDNVKQIILKNIKNEGYYYDY